MNRQGCEVKMFNILEGVDHPSDVSDISNYSKLRKPRRLPLSSDAGAWEKQAFARKCDEKSPSQGSKRSKRPPKEKKEDQMPELFTCPLMLKSPNPSTSTSEPTSTDAASKQLCTPRTLPKSLQEKSRSVERGEAEMELPADEEELTKNACEFGEDSANDGVYTCRWGNIVLALHQEEP